MFFESITLLFIPAQQIIIFKMKKNFLIYSILSTLFFTLFIQGCEQRKENPFVDEVIRKLGKNGKACFEKDNKTYCIVKASKKNKVISVGEKFKPKEKLMVALQSSDKLTDWTEIKEYVCDDAGMISLCWCVGLEDCLVMAQNERCTVGKCGECGVGDCCCPVLKLP